MLIDHIRFLFKQNLEYYSNGWIELKGNFTLIENRTLCENFYSFLCDETLLLLRNILIFDAEKYALLGFSFGEYWNKGFPTQQKVTILEINSRFGLNFIQHTFGHHLCIQ